MNQQKGLQEQYSPNGICFGCGPSNSKGLKIRSIVEGDQVVARWKPETHHEAFPGVLNGGIIGSLLALSLELDCSMASNAAAKNGSPSLYCDSRV